MTHQWPDTLVMRWFEPIAENDHIAAWFHREHQRRLELAVRRATQAIPGWLRHRHGYADLYQLAMEWHPCFDAASKQSGYTVVVKVVPRYEKIKSLQEAE